MCKPRIDSRRMARSCSMFSFQQRIAPFSSETKTPTKTSVNSLRSRTINHRNNASHLNFSDFYRTFHNHTITSPQRGTLHRRRAAHTGKRKFFKGPSGIVQGCVRCSFPETACASRPLQRQPSNKGLDVGDKYKPLCSAKINLLCQQEGLQPQES